MSTPAPKTDTTLVNRAGVDYRITLDKMSTLNDTDLLLVNRAGVDYRCTAKDVKAVIGGGGPPGAPTNIKVPFTAMEMGYMSTPIPDYVTMAGDKFVSYGGTVETNATRVRLSTQVRFKTPYGFHCGTSNNEWINPDATAKAAYPYDPDPAYTAARANLGSIAPQMRNWHNNVNGVGGAFFFGRLPRLGNGWGYLCLNSQTELANGNFDFYYFTDPSTDVVQAVKGFKVQHALGNPLGGNNITNGGADFRWGKDFLLMIDATQALHRFDLDTTTGTLKATKVVNKLTPPYLGKYIVKGEYLFLHQDDGAGNITIKRNVSKSDYSSFVPINTNGLTSSSFIQGGMGQFYVSKAGNYYHRMTDPAHNYAAGWAVSTDDGLNWSWYGGQAQPQSFMFEPDHDLFMTYSNNQSSSVSNGSIVHLP